jgi:hypothetical protein
VAGVSKGVPVAEVEDLKSRSERLASGPRLAEIDRVTGALENALPAPPEGSFAALGAILTDAILDWDEAALSLLLDQLPRLAALAGRGSGEEALRTEGRLLGLIDVAQKGMQRALPGDLLGHVEPGSHTHMFLREIESNPTLTNAAIGFELGIDETSVSRTGRRLVQSGLARKRRLGRTNQWLITPRGVQVLKVLDTGGVSRPTREHRQLV